MKTRKPADPAARLALLLAGQKQLAEGDVLSMADLAKALGMTARNLKLTIDSDPEFPVLSRGGEGIAWQFDAAAVFAHLIARCREAVAEREARVDRINRLSGFGGPRPDAAGRGNATPSPAANAGLSDELDPDALHRIAQAQMTAHRLKQLQGQFMPAAETTAFLLDYHSQFQSETLGLLGKIDPAGQLPAELRREVENGIRSILVGLQDRMERFLDRKRVPAAA